MPRNTCHRLIAGHLLDLLFAVIILSIKTIPADQRQSDILEDLSHESSTALRNFIITVVLAALPHPYIEAAIAHEHSPVCKIGKRSGLPEESCYVLFADHSGSGRRNVWVFFP